LNQPINETLGVRLVVQKQSADSETNRVSSRQSFIAPSLALNIDRDRKFVLRLKRVENDWSDSVGLPSQTAARNGNLTAEGIPKSTMNADTINAHYTQRLNDTWKFDLVVAETRAKFDQRAMFYLTPGGAESARLNSDMKTNVISPSLTSKFDVGTSKHTLLLGAEQVKTRDHGYVVSNSNLVPTGLGPPYDPLPAWAACSFGAQFGFGNALCTYTRYSAPYAAWVEPTAPADPYNKISSTTNAIYVQDQIDIGQWHLQAGLRYAQTELNDYYGNDPSIALGVARAHDRTTRLNKVLPRFGAVYDLTPKASLFAGYGQGMRVPMYGTYRQPIKAEDSEQTEVGVRLKDWNGISATLAWFDLTRTNVPTNDNNGYTYQVGKQNSKGLDLNLAWKANKSLTVLGGLSDQKAITVENQYNAASVGKSLQNVPSQTARLAMRYDVREGDLAGLGFGFGLRHHSKLAADSSNINFTPAATVYDSQVSYRMKGVSLNLAINNLLDKEYVVPSSQSLSAGPLYFPAPRRTVMLTATMDF
jgi:iron complex outermembrane receptor protein